MHTLRTMVVGVFRNRLAAQQCYDVLINRGFHDADINVMMSEQTRSLYGEAPESRAAFDRAGNHTKAAEGMGIGGAVGTLVGGSIAAIVAVGTSLVLPGLNLIVAGPLAAALAGGGAGALTGGLLGGLIGLGIPEEGAEAYHQALREGGTVLGVAVPDGEHFTEAKQTLMDCGAEHVHRVN
jgi:hypothetical protein